VCELNCHFVSRFLTKPWELRNRQLWCYDFERKQIRKRPSKSLFAEAGRNSPEIEKRLNHFIERPIANAITTLVPSGAIDNVEIAEWPLFRAINLLFLVQHNRVAEKDSLHSGLSQTLLMDEAQLDQLVLACQETDMIAGLRGNPQAPLCYPSQGFFGIPIRRPSGSYATVYAIPLTENFVLARVPRDLRIDDMVQTITLGTGGLFTNCSVGLKSPRVVIPPSVMKAHGAPTAAQMMEDARKLVREQFLLCGEMNRLDREIAKIWNWGRSATR
jgi:hypothetical protein